VIPRQSKVAALTAGLVLVMTAIAVAAVTVNPLIAFTSVFVLIGAANLALAVWSTSIAIRRGAESMAAALGLPTR
jgi:hypothetical protein